MIASLMILFQTRKAFDYLDEQYEDTLESNCTLIFGLLGATSGISTFFKEKIQLPEQVDSSFLILFLIIAIAFGAVIGVLIGKYVTTYVLYGMSKLLKGNPEVIDIRVVAAYSLIPMILLLPIILYNGIQGWENIPYDYYWIFDLISIIVWIWILKILIQGIMRFTNFGLMKSLLNISPILMLGIIRLILRFF